MIEGKVAFRQIEGAIALIVQAVIALRRNRQISAVLAVDGPIHAPGDAVLKEWSRDSGSRLRSQGCHQIELGERCRRLGNRRVLALAFNSEKGEQLFLLQRAADGAAKPLPGVRWDGRN